MNQLSNEKSPYLLQHAHNPVDWRPWGEAAFDAAREQEKPIFLSIGYSTCHWCHVMEHESFENAATAQLMNDNFINIKVDREERPDVDRMYMTFVQATAGQGGWPLSIFLTPDLKPFFGGTYFPPQDAYGRVGFPSLLQRVADAWKNDRKNVLESSESVIAALSRYASLGQKSNGPKGKDGDINWQRINAQCFEHFQNTHDVKYGGFGDAPKFPRPVVHDFLHRYKADDDDSLGALEMSERTLRAMADGGVFDHLGGGFHRYAVDSQWIVSHFEKMLYDQAQLVVSYLEMYQITRDEYFAGVARSTLDYVLRDMTHEAGGFFAAEDADSLPDENADHKAEGAFYVWTQQEIEEVLGEDDAKIFCKYFGVKPNGNAPQEGDPHGEFRGKNILHRVKNPDESARRVLSECSAKLLVARDKRPRPHRDDKIIVAWNGLTISAFSRAAQVLNEPRYLKAAERAAQFIKRELWDESTQSLRRHYKDGAADVAAFAEDFTFLTRGLLDLYEASAQTEYLDWARALSEQTLDNFWDEQDGGLFSSAADERVLLRFKEDYDGAEPSPNSVASENLARLWQLCGDEKSREKAAAIFETFAPRLEVAAPAMPFLLAAKLLFDAPPLHIVILGNKDSDDTKQLLKVVYERFLPSKVLIVRDESMNPNLPAFVSEMKQLDGKATAYVCRDFACRQPVRDPEMLREELDVV